MHSLLTNMMADVHAAELHEHAGHGRAVPGHNPDPTLGAWRCRRAPWILGACVHV